MSRSQNPITDSSVDTRVNKKTILFVIKNKRITGATRRQLARRVRRVLNACPRTQHKIEQIIGSLIDRFVVVFENCRLRALSPKKQQQKIADSRRAKMESRRKALSQQRVPVDPTIVIDELVDSIKPAIPPQWADEFGVNTDPYDPRLLAACGLASHKLAA